MTDIAVCPSGEMYGIDWTQLYSIDPITGASTYLGNIESSFNNLVCGPDNTLYAVHNGSQTLNIIDPHKKRLGWNIQRTTCKARHLSVPFSI